MFFGDYKTEPIGDGNPYYCCAHCKRSTPEINGTITKHAWNCPYRIEKTKELILLSQQDIDYIVDDYTKERFFYEFERNDFHDMIQIIILKNIEKMKL